MKSVLFERNKLAKRSTGSSRFDFFLGGGLPHSSITDVFGAAGTGKTQFAFQNVVMSCAGLEKQTTEVPNVVYVDCSGSFRPERIAEIAQNRSLDADEILKEVFAISVRTVEEQVKACRQIGADSFFSNCELLVIDDVSTNFVIEYDDENVANRQNALTIFMRELAFMAQKKGMSILITNSVRYRGENVEGETTGEVMSQFSLCRMQFLRKDHDRFAAMLQPETDARSFQFEIVASGIP